VLHRRACASLLASFAGRSRGRNPTNKVLLASPRSPPSVALCPRVAARSSMSGASWWAMKAAACGRETLVPFSWATRRRAEKSHAPASRRRSSTSVGVPGRVVAGVPACRARDCTTCRTTIGLGCRAAPSGACLATPPCRPRAVPQHEERSRTRAQRPCQVEGGSVDRQGSPDFHRLMLRRLSLLAYRPTS
jgi:hypothetical protein